MTTPNLPPFRQALALLKAHRHYERIGADPYLESRMEARDDAYPKFVRQVLPLLAANQLDQTLAFLVERKEMKAKELERVRATIQGLVTSRGVRNAQGEPATAFLLALPLAGLAATPPVHADALIAALTADLKGLLKVPEGASPLQILPLETPIHPIAFASLSLNQRYALLGDWLPGERERPRLERLRKAHQSLICPAKGAPAVDRRSAVWPMLVVVPHTLTTTTPLEMVLDLASLLPDSWPATTALFAPLQVRQGTLQMIDLAILQGLFLHLRQTALDSDPALPPDAELRLDALVPSPGGQGLQVTLAQGDRLLDPLYLPFVWLAQAGEVQQAVAQLIAHFNPPHQDDLPDPGEAG